MITKIIGAIEVVGICTCQALGPKQAVVAVGRAVCRQNGSGRAGTVGQVVVILALGAIGIIITLFAELRATVAGECGAVEVEVVFLALEADCVVVAEVAADFAGLAGQPGVRYVECAIGTPSEAIETYVVLIAQLHAVNPVPPQAPRSWGIVVGIQPH